MKTERMEYSEALEYTRSQGAVALKWAMAPNAVSMPKQKLSREDKLKRRLRLIRKAGIDV